MTETLLNCAPDGWFALASGVTVLGLVALTGAALVKYLFFSGRSGAVA